MYNDLFSKRYNLRPTAAGLMYEDVPERARIGLLQILERAFYDERQEIYLALYKEICVALRILRNRGVTQNWEAIRALEQLIMHCNWWEYYDICQVMWSNPISEYSEHKHQEDLTTQINALFKEEHLGFELKNGKVEKVGSGFIDAQIKEARYLLKEAEFKGADEHFEKAIKAINVRPNPDSENCVKDAVAAIESVGRVITKDDKALLDNVIKDLTNKGIIPKPLDQVIQKVNAYRGNEPGVAHGAVAPSKVTPDEAEFVLALSAASIIYLVKKRSLV